MGYKWAEHLVPLSLSSISARIQVWKQPLGQQQPNWPRYELCHDCPPPPPPPPWTLPRLTGHNILMGKGTCKSCPIKVWSNMKQQGALQCLYVPSSVVGLWLVVLHNDGYCNGCVTERCLHDSTNMILFHAWSMLEEKRFKNLMFLSFYEKNIGFDGNLVSNKFVLWCTSCKIYRYIATPSDTQLFAK